jgi:hypothetical protein
MGIAKFIQRTTDSMFSVLESWGFVRRQASSTVSHGSAAVRVLLATPSGVVHIGTLMRDGGEYVFSYTPAFAASSLPAIGEFPDKGREYRSATLWPFFEVRMPRVGREDVKTVMAAKKIDPHDELRLLGELAKKSVASPYELTYEAATAG